MAEFTKTMIFLVACYCVCNAIASAVFYMEVSLPESIKSDASTATMSVHKFHYQCNMRDTCNFVIKDTRSQKYTIYDKEDDLPSDRHWYRIWRKMPDIGRKEVTNQVSGEPLGNVSDTCKLKEKPNVAYASCQDAYDKGQRSTTVYPIIVPNIGIVNIGCDMTTDGGGWMVFQRRIDATVDFYRTWNEYKDCFGDLNGNFWLGLDILHQLAAPGKGAILYVRLIHMDAGDKYAKYSKFEISNESLSYKIAVGGYSGTAPDSLLYNDGHPFSTKDTSVCAVQRKGGWWYDTCTWANLNGLYPTNGDTNADIMSWYFFKNNWGRVTFSEMKIKYKVS